MPAGSQEYQEISLLRGRISKLEAQIQFLYKHLGVTFVPEAVANDDAEIVEYLKKGDVMRAIRAHRSTYNSDLAQAKAAVDDIRSRVGL